jgi:hypothetical protein
MVARQKRCEFCGRFFTPNRRVGNRQRSCGRTECKKARKTAAQQTWVNNNPGYFKGRYDNTRRWRRAHPDYQRQRRQKIREIQDETARETPVKSVRLLVPAKWFKDEIQDTMVTLTLLDTATYISTVAGVRYKTRCTPATADGISSYHGNH